jgi:hypothetical protein
VSDQLSPSTSVLAALRSPKRLRTEVLAELVVALALIPEAISFSIIAGVDPRVGLFASFTMAVTIAIVGGRPAMISAATGSVALVIGPLVPGDVYVRTWYRRDTGWFGHAVGSGRARIRIPGVEVDVRVEDVGVGPAGLKTDVDAAYRGKYGGGSTGDMVGDDAVATTLRLHAA